MGGQRQIKRVERISLRPFRPSIEVSPATRPDSYHSPFFYCSRCLAHVVCHVDTAWPNYNQLPASLTASLSVCLSVYLSVLLSVLLIDCRCRQPPQA